MLVPLHRFGGFEGVALFVMLSYFERERERERERVLLTYSMVYKGQSHISEQMIPQRVKTKSKQRK